MFMIRGKRRRQRSDTLKFAVGPIWLDHEGSLRYCDVWFRTNIKFEGEDLDAEVVDE
jgi:hypothetical protein